MRDTQPTTPLIRITPALIHIQAHLDQDLSLDLLADEVRLSKFHFHQLFRRVTGETPKSYVDRLRLERAALQLRIRRASVLQIALKCGYQNHETFSRAFRTHFGVSPRDYRQQWPQQEPTGPSAGYKRGNDSPHAMLSSTRMVRLARLIVGFLRHVGPYEQVAPSHFRRLSTWAKRRGIAGESPLLLGIAHDAPGVTPAERIRFDCCIQVPEVFEPDGVIACQRTPGGDYAVTEYIGSWDLGPAYSAIFRRILNNPSLEVIGLPAIEIYPTARIGRRRGLAHVSIAIPVKLRKSLSTGKRGDSLTAGATMRAP